MITNQQRRALLLVENNPYPQDFRVRREAETLRDNDYDVSVIAPRHDEQPWSERLNGVQVYRFPLPAGGSGVLGYAAEFAYATVAILFVSIWVWWTRGVDVVHAANPPDTLVAVGALLKLFGKRFVFDQHDLAPETYLSRFERPRRGVIYWVLCVLEGRTYALADAVIVTNQSYAQVAINRGRVPPSRVFVVRNGPPAAYGPAAPIPQLVARARYRIGYVGTIGPQDGVDYWIRALRELVFTMGRTDVLAVVIGDGDAAERVRALAKELSVDTHVWFTGRLSEEEVRRHLSSVDVCVQPDPLNPLNDKSTMNKLMEYMALGKPTVAFDLKETRYSAQESAVYVHPNDEIAFARAVAWLLDNPAERARMGGIGERRVREGLTWEHSAGELVRAYASCFQHESSHGCAAGSVRLETAGE